MKTKSILAITITLLLILSAQVTAAGKPAPWWAAEKRGKWWEEGARWTVTEFNRYVPEPLFYDDYDYDNEDVIDLAESRGWIVVREQFRPRVGAIIVWKSERDGSVRMSIIREVTGRNMVYHYYDEETRRPHYWRNHNPGHYRDYDEYTFVGYIYPERRHRY